MDDAPQRSGGRKAGSSGRCKGPLQREDPRAHSPGDPRSRYLNGFQPSAHLTEGTSLEAVEEGRGCKRNSQDAG